MAWPDFELSVAALPHHRHTPKSVLTSTNQLECKSRVMNPIWLLPCGTQALGVQHDLYYKSYIGMVMFVLFVIAVVSAVIIVHAVVMSDIYTVLHNRWAWCSFFASCSSILTIWFSSLMCDRDICGKQNSLLGLKISISLDLFWGQLHAAWFLWLGSPPAGKAGASL